MQALLFITIALFVFVCVVLILLVLIQKGRGGGLASAFGGGGGNTAFGSKTGDVLTWATSIVFGIFLLLAIALSLTADQVNAQKYPTTQKVQQPMDSGQRAPVTGSDTPAPAPTLPPAPAAPSTPLKDPLKESTTQPAK